MSWALQEGDPRRIAKVGLLIPPPIALPGEFPGCCMEWGRGFSGLWNSALKDIHVLLLRTHEYDLVDRRSLSSYNEGALFEISLSDLYCSKGHSGMRGKNMGQHSRQSSVTCSHQDKLTTLRKEEEEGKNPVSS